MALLAALALALGGALSVIASAPGVARAACLLLCPTTTTSPPVTTTTTPTTTTTAPPPPPAVVPGAEYAGRASDFHYVVIADVSSDGSRVTNFTAEVNAGQCSDGMRYSTGDEAGGHWAISDSTATITSRFKAITQNRRGRLVRGHEAMTIKLSFAHDRISGTISDRFTGKHYGCSSGIVSVAGGRVGSPVTPAVPRIASGLYTFQSRDGSLRAYVYPPLRMVFWVAGRWRSQCLGTGSFMQSNFFRDVAFTTPPSSYPPGLTHSSRYSSWGTVGGHRHRFITYSSVQLQFETTTPGRAGISFDVGGGTSLAGSPVSCSGSLSGVATLRR
jgi:hypothetical protein